MREPTVVRWPGKIPAGKPNDELMTTMDLLPTFAKLAGAEIPADRVIDGKGHLANAHRPGGNTAQGVLLSSWQRSSVP